ncbi:MAG: LytTR family DNA-binding domain-containing protein [Chitinophagaceae bacterium]|jgi:two-component system LytT family response regulator|nr:LytTR family DNA-binding domain-containing protein [Chitinophagaceae bacterium]
MITCIIIDDEAKARLLLKNMIADITSNVTVLADCDDLPNGIKAIKKLKPDIVFLDIEMPGHNGLSILDFFDEGEVNFDIVFTTGYSEYAIQAFKLSATDYLLKPINPELLQATIEKIFKKEERNKLINYKALQENIVHNTDASDKCIIVNLSGTTKFIKVKEIILLEAEGSYCKLFLTNGEKLTTSKNLKYFEERLVDFNYFFRCHKSNIINLKFVTEFNKSELEVTLAEKLTALMSTDKAEQFLEKMEQLH